MSALTECNKYNRSPYNGEYILPRDESDGNRLNGLHWIFVTSVYGGHLIFDKNMKLGSYSRVLDSGTGTGVWLMDMAQRVSGTVELYGSDISDSRFPVTKPPNICFHVASVTDYPEQWTNSFDFVHQRLLIGALTARDWNKAISELLRVLKPGGSVQLVEFHSADVANAGPSYSQFRAIFEALLEKRGMLSDCAIQIPRMLKTAGFVDVIATRKLVPIGGPGEVGQLCGSHALTGFRGLSQAILSEGLSSSEDEYGALISRIEEEFKGPECLEQAVWVICAKKSL